MNFKSRMGFFLLSLLSINTAFAGTNQSRFDALIYGDLPAPSAWKKAFNLLMPSLSPEDKPAAEEAHEVYLSQKLDHFSASDARSFKQRFFLNSKYATDGAVSPVIFYICGEAPCTTRFMNGFAGEVAKKLGAHMVALEHRYYGKSFPFLSLTNENLTYLSTAQALEDLAQFQTYVMKEVGLKGKWLVIGGSYAGSLAAYYRQLHPDLVSGALASSAPVESRSDYVEFDYHAALVAGPHCAEALRTVLQQAEHSYKDPAAFIQFKMLMSAEEIQDPDDFFYFLADIGAQGIQYGQRDALCQRLSEADVIQGYAKYIRESLKKYNATAVSYTAQDGLEIVATENGSSARQWFYQSCTEYGYWQNAYSDSKLSMRLPRTNAQYHAGICKRLYGMSDPAKTKQINSKYYEPLLREPTSNIFFTNSAQDPWAELSISRVRGNDKNPATETAWIEGKGHCSELKASQESDLIGLVETRARFLELAQRWVR